MYNGECKNKLCGYGGIGRRARFRFWCQQTCRFNSCYPHFLIQDSHCGSFCLAGKHLRGCGAKMTKIAGGRCGSHRKRRKEGMEKSLRRWRVEAIGKEEKGGRDGKKHAGVAREKKNSLTVLHYFC